MNKYLDEKGLAKVLGHIKELKANTWVGTLDEWNNLPDSEKDKYDRAEIIDVNDTTGGDSGSGESGASSAEVEALQAQVNALQTQLSEMNDTINNLTGAIDGLLDNFDNTAQEIEEIRSRPKIWKGNRSDWDALGREQRLYDIAFVLEENNEINIEVTNW